MCTSHSDGQGMHWAPALAYEEERMRYEDNFLLAGREWLLVDEREEDLGEEVYT